MIDVRLFVGFIMYQFIKSVGGAIAVEVRVWVWFITVWCVAPRDLKIAVNMRFPFCQLYRKSCRKLHNVPLIECHQMNHSIVSINFTSNQQTAHSILPVSSGRGKWIFHPRHINFPCHVGNCFPQEHLPNRLPSVPSVCHKSVVVPLPTHL